ncbi:beta-ketoacyl-ACP synthase III [Breznakiellaceae bacterium SP9]
MAVIFKGTGSFIPPRLITNEELAKKIDTTDEWIFSHTGINNRHVVEGDVATSDLAFEAAKRALLQVARCNGGTETEEQTALTLDAIVVATATPDHYCCPSVSCVLQARLGAMNAACLDINAGCTGFIYALETAAGLLSINGRRKRALIVGAETLSKFVDWDDRRTCVLFGDGAGAVVVEKKDTAQGAPVRGLISSVLHADGSGAEHLKMQRGGSRHPYTKGEVVDVPPHFDMDGRAVYKFAVKALTDTIEEILKLENKTIADITRIVPHQANARIVQAAAKRLGIPDEKFFLNIENYANTSAASIPIALDEMNRGGLLKDGDVILTTGFGAGLTYGGNLFVWGAE